MNIAILITLLGLSAGAATITAVSNSRADVNTAINTTASRGDTVLIPNGSATWSSGVTITKGVSLMPVTRGGLTLTSSGGITFLTLTPDATAIANGELIRVDGITFDGANSSPDLIDVNGVGAAGTKPFTNFAIGNCTFKNTSTVTSGQGTISIVGQTRGVIYSNTFDRCNVIVKDMGNDDTAEWTGGHFPFNFGTSDNLFFEGNAIKFSSSYAGADPGWMETGQGQRMCCRYNTYDWNHANTPTEIWDIHGAQNWPGGQTGTMISEYYGNSGVNASQFRWINHRGGWGLYFDNVFTGSGGMDIQANQYVGCVANTGAPSEELTNSYCWNNTMGGTVLNMFVGDGNNCANSEGVTFRNYNASFNGTVGVGRGTTTASAAFPTCTKGVGYWQAATATPTTSPAVIQAGTFWQATAANTWTAIYQPYTFPNPIVTALEGIGGTILQAMSLGSDTMRIGGGTTMRIGQ